MEMGGKCPPNLLAPLIKIVIEEIRKTCKKQPLSCGFNPKDNAYEPLKLMQSVMAKMNEVCLRYQDNSLLCSLPSPAATVYFPTSVWALRNTRRRMEDRHVVVHDLNTTLNIQEASPSSYYAVFDGHDGHTAAAYAAAHLHQFLGESEHYSSNPAEAIMEAFKQTDSLFINKCEVEGIGSGTTAVVSLLRHKEKMLYTAWVGDSQAILVKEGKVMQLVDPHKPSRSDERERIEKAGGCVLLWGTWRVNGQLAVSRAIGDPAYKPYVTAIPDIRAIPLEGNEDFLILACDGLWDHLTEEQAAEKVYYLLRENPDDLERVGKHLVQAARSLGSTDNISAVVVFLREAHLVAAAAAAAPVVEAVPAPQPLRMEAAFDAAAAQQQAAAPSPQDQSLLDLIGPAATAFQANGQYLGTDLSPTNNFFASEKSNGDRTGFDDFGPETDVDAVDNILSPVEKTKSAFAEGLSKAIASDGMFNPFLEHQEKAAFELDSHDLFKQTTEEFDVHRDARDETPTPPAETVHDVGGLVETGVDSDSEDEWNYFKGDSANKENENPVAKRNKKSTVSEGDTTTKEENPEDDMSQLNPDAAEFVPVSPVRTATSPMSILSRSPKKPINFDVNVPDENEFESEVRHRPSDIGPGLLTSNGHSKENDDSPDSGVIQNILNGKNIDEIPEFLPGSTPSKTANDEFHFGPNAGPFTPSRQILDQSETALSTKAVFGDESVATLGTTFNESTVESLDNVTNKESDTMSMSFYAEKGDTNPFDLNEVQLLPDNLDEFLKSDEPSKESELNETLSNRPPSDLLAEVQANNDDAIQITDLDKASVDDEKELASPIEPEKDLDDFKVLSPQPTQENLLGDYLCERPESLSPRPESSNSISESKSPLPEENVCGLEKSPEPTPHVVEEDLSAPEAIKSQSPDIVEPPQSQSPGIFEVSKSPEVCELRKSPEVCELSKSEVCELRKTPEVSEFQQSPDVCQTIPPKSPEVCAFTPSKSPDICSFQLSKSPEILDRPESKSPVCDIPIAKSPDLIEQNSPVDEHKDLVEEEITSSIKDDVSSPVENMTSPVYSPEPQQKIEAITEQAPVVDVIQQISEAVEQVADTVQEILPELIPTESVETSQPFEPLPMDHPLAKCVFPLPTQNGEHIEVKTENIAPQFAEPEIVTPSEESKHEDIVPSAPLIEGLTEEPKPDIVQESIEHLKAPEVVSVTAEEKKPEIKPVEEKVEKKEVKKAATAVEKKPSTAKSPAARTPAAKPSPRTTPSAPKAATPRLSTTPKAAPAKTTPSKPTSTPNAKTTAAKPSPKPKTSTTTAAPKPLERKPLLNGDIKKPATTLRKPPTETKTAAKPATAAAPKPSAAKPAPRPATAPRVSATKPPATARPATAAAAAPKPRPTTLTSRTITATKTTTTATKATTNGTTKPATSPRTALAAKPRPPTTITSTKPRVPLTKTITKTTTSPDAAKQQKDSVNKLTASRTLTSARSVTATATSKTTTTTVRRVESKVSATAGRTTVSKTSTTVMKSAAGKKPTEITRTTKAKTATTKVEKPQENGVSHTTTTEEITVVNNSINESIDLQKDNSPMDNKLIVNNGPIETHATD